jgi:hypothetical protein
VRVPDLEVDQPWLHFAQASMGVSSPMFA